MSETPISPLRRRMIEDMTVRNFVEKCQCRLNFPQKRRSKFPQVAASVIRCWRERGLWAWADGHGGAAVVPAAAAR
jgi:hypothetical protein